MSTTHVDGVRVAVRRPMNPWRLEWLRMVRTPRAVSLLGVYVVFGLLAPVLAKYMAELMKYAQTEMTITFRPPLPRDGITNYVNQVSQTGLIVAVVVAAGALALDSRRGISTFLRTRTTNMWGLVLPRYLVTSAFAVLAYVLGTLAAWYETALLIGALPAGPMLAGVLCETVFLLFAISVVALAASLARSTLGTIGISLAVLLVLPIVGIVGVVHDWVPSTLMTAPVELLTTAGFIDYLPALCVSLIAIPVLLATAVARLRLREY